MQKWSSWLVFLGVFIGVAIICLTTIEVSFERSKEVKFCGSCHFMESYVKGMQDPKSDLLSAKHYQRGWISERQCSTCHADYGFLGPLESKWRGFQHIVHFYLITDKDKKLHLYKPFPNENCLHCHGRTKRFNENPTHEPLLCQLRTDDVSCVSCHGPVHPSHVRKSP